MFADDGISGTPAKKRPEFLRMIEECEQGNPHSAPPELY